MSGGSMDYLYYRVEEAAYAFNGKHKLDKELFELVKDVSKLLHDREWYDSSDYGDDTYMKCVKEFKDKWFKTNRSERLEKIINEAIQETKEELLELIGGA